MALNKGNPPTHGSVHRHSQCDHCLHACEPCDTAYCCRCPAHWKNCHQSHGSIYPWYGETTPPTTPLTGPTWSTSVSDFKHEGVTTHAHTGG